MGLDITCYTNITLVKEECEEIECLWEWDDNRESFEQNEFGTSLNLVVLQGNDSFPKHFTSPKGVYSYDDSCCVISRAYSGWSNVRDELAKAAGYSPITSLECWEREWDYDNAKIRPYQSSAFARKSGLLHELINFSDCEGVIGVLPCQKIYQDLLKCDVSLLSEYGLRAYKELVEGFKYASENKGVMSFS